MKWNEKLKSNWVQLEYSIMLWAIGNLNMLFMPLKHLDSTREILVIIIIIDFCCYREMTIIIIAINNNHNPIDNRVIIICVLAYLVLTSFFLSFLHFILKCICRWSFFHFCSCCEYICKIVVAVSVFVKTVPWC